MTPQTAALETTCYVCGKTTVRVVWREGPYEGRRCGCGLTYTHPMPEQRAVDKTLNLHPDEFYADAVAFKVGWLKRHCRGNTLMEVGCDQGLLLEQARERGFAIAGLEPDARRAAFAEQRLQIPIERCFLEERPEDGDTYDVVYHDDLLAHFTDPVASLRKMVAMLRPGGVLAFEVGILGGVSPIWYRVIGRLSLQHHLFLYSRESLRMLLDRAELDVVEMSVFGLAPTVALSKLFAAAKRSAGFVSPALERRVLRWSQRGRAFARYRIGAITPAIGPLTLLIVARPRRAQDPS